MAWRVGPRRLLMQKSFASFISPLALESDLECSFKLRLLLRGDILVHHFLQHFEWDGAGAKDHVVKFLQGKLLAQLAACLVAQFQNLQLANHISASLAGPYNIAFHFANRDPIVDGLL